MTSYMSMCLWLQLPGVIFATKEIGETFIAIFGFRWAQPNWERFADFLEQRPISETSNPPGG